MKDLVYILFIVLLASFVVGCETNTRYKVLSLFFDGVPNPEAPSVQAGGKSAGEGAGGIKDQVRPTYREHGPFASKSCKACHNVSTNELVMPIDKLCLYCHVILTDKRLLHGPVAAGGCRICHDPHGSSYPFLLVSEPKKFCLYCHNKVDIEKNEAHKGVDADCTECHDAHASNNDYLLK